MVRPPGEQPPSGARPETVGSLLPSRGADAGDSPSVRPPAPVTCRSAVLPPVSRPRNVPWLLFSAALSIATQRTVGCRRRSDPRGPAPQRRGADRGRPAHQDRKRRQSARSATHCDPDQATGHPTSGDQHAVAVTGGRPSSRRRRRADPRAARRRLRPARHDRRPPRRPHHGMVNTLTDAGSTCWADTAYLGAAPVPRSPRLGDRTALSPPPESGRCPG